MRFGILEHEIGRTMETIVLSDFANMWWLDF